MPLPYRIKNRREPSHSFPYEPGTATWRGTALSTINADGSGHRQPFGPYTRHDRIDVATILADHPPAALAGYGSVLGRQWWGLMATDAWVHVYGNTPRDIEVAAARLKESIAELGGVLCGDCGCLLYEWEDFALGSLVPWDDLCTDCAVEHLDEFHLAPCSRALIDGEYRVCGELVRVGDDPSLCPSCRRALADQPLAQLIGA